jgi:hypothetical protein
MVPRHPSVDEACDDERRRPCFDAGWHALIRTLLGRELLRGPEDSIDRLKSRAEELYPRRHTGLESGRR